MRYYRKVIRVRAEDSPNVKYAMAQIERGLPVTHETICPGVLTYADYVKRRVTWDKVRQSIGLDGLFWEGAEVLLFPPLWLDAAEKRHKELRKDRRALAIGIDPAEGGDKTAMAAVDEYGLIELVSRRTPDTSVITTEAIRFAEKHGVPPERICFDRGGGGKQHADRLRAMGWRGVRTVAFGESLVLDPKRGIQPTHVRKDNREERYEYLNRRAQMYGELSELLDPAGEGTRFAIPEGITGDLADPQSELRHQLAPIPRLYDAEGRLRMLPKNNPKDADDDQTLVKLIGHSPDEADAVVLAVHAMLHKQVKMFAGVV